MERSTGDVRMTEDSPPEEEESQVGLTEPGGDEPETPGVEPGGEEPRGEEPDAPAEQGETEGTEPVAPAGSEAGTESGLDVPAGEGAAETEGGGLFDLTTEEPSEPAETFDAPTGSEEAVAEAAGPSETADVIQPEPSPEAPAQPAGAPVAEAESFPETEVEEPPAVAETAAPSAAEAVPEPQMDLPVEEAAPAEEEMLDASVESTEATAQAEPSPAPSEPAAEEEEAPARRRDPFRGPGDWYVVHTYAGYENKVKANLASRINSMQMQDKIFDVHIPMEDVMEIKGGKKQVVQKKVFPGYLLVKMVYDNDSWYVVRNTPGVTGFVSSGTGTKPTPLSRREVEKILSVKEEETAKSPRFRLEFEEGDMVRIIAGPFADFNGKISEINVDQSKLKVLVSIFDRETPVELGFDQVAKV